jgi:RNA polymerase sigma-70 factor (ECF subfamily)
MRNTRSSVLVSATRFARRGPANDEALIAAVAAGDAGAMRVLYNRHHVGVFRFITRLVGDATAAEDIVSETFIDVWRQAGTFEGRSAVLTWVMSIARFKALSARRGRHDVELDDTVAETIADQASTPEQVVLEMDRTAQLRDCLTRLTAQHREIIDLVYYHHKTIEEVAEIVQVPKNTVKTRMFHARKRLAGLLARHEDFNRMTPAASRSSLRSTRSEVGAAASARPLATELQ